MTGDLILTESWPGHFSVACGIIALDHGEDASAIKKLQFDVHQSNIDLGTGTIL
jgi:hypothetical protein